MAFSFLKVISRRIWVVLGVFAIIASYIPWLVWPSEPVGLLAPLVVSSICILHSQRRWPVLLAASLFSVGALCLINTPQAASQWRSLLGLLAGQTLVGISSSLIPYMPWGLAEAQSRLTDRLRRQSEQLQEFRENEQTTARTVAQIETDQRELLEHLPVHVVQKNRLGEFVFVTQSFCDMMNRTFGEVIGKTDFDIFPEDAARKFVEDDQEIMRTGGVLDDVEGAAMPDGSEVFMRVRKAPTRDPDGSITGIQCIFWDVTDEHQRRKQLQRIESMTRALINAALDAVLIVDADGYVLEANPASERVLGYTHEGKSHPPLGSIIETSFQEATDRSHEVSEDGIGRKVPIAETLHSATGKRIEVKLRRSDNIWFDGEISAHPLHVDGSEGWAIFIRDITRRKQAQEELLRAKESAEQANAAKTEFVANVSHELRTPLTGIVGLHELLDRGRLEDSQREYLRLARVSTSNLLTLIDDLLDFSKIESGHIDVEHVPFSLLDCVEQAVTAMAARAQLKGLELLIQYVEPLSDAVLGDPLRIRQILLNLIGNGIKFTERGEIRVKVEMIPDDVKQFDDAALEGDGGQSLVRFEVHDTGIGIAPHKRQMIFDAFRQADSSTTRRYGGTGLGLTICRDLVNSMGGVIGVSQALDMENRLVTGSCFFFELPFELQAKVSEKRSAAALIPSNRASQKQHIVIAAAESSWRKLLEAELNRQELTYTTMTVAQLLEKEPPELFAAGNHTVVIADQRELHEFETATAPVVVKWILLFAMTPESGRQAPGWLRYADVEWLSRPIQRSAFERALFTGGPASGILPKEVDPIAVGRSGSILLVEDSPISQTVLRDMLQGLGHQVEVVNNGLTAIECCERNAYDLVLMDIQMPELDGLEATREIRAAELSVSEQSKQPATRQTICALTAHATASDRAQCEAAGMDGFLVKPLSLDRLAAAVSRLLKGESLFEYYEEGEEKQVARVDLEHESLDGPRLGALSKKGAEERSDQELASNDAEDVSLADTTFVNLDVARALDDALSWPELVETLNGNPDLLRDVLRLLTGEAPKLARNCVKGIESESWGEVRRAAHTMKGNVRHLKLMRVGKYLERLESLAKEQRISELQDQQSVIHEISNLVVDWAEKMLRENP